MIVNFLTSDGLRLAKKFTQTEKSPYPHAFYFTSHKYEVTDIKDFFDLITQYADLGGCLLKGTLTKQLNNESRAGSTNPSTPSHLIVIDIDRTDPQINTPEDYIQHCLPPEFHNASYIWQWSNSAKITKHCLCGHLFFISATPLDAGQLKQYFTYLNFYAPQNETQIRLNANGLTLSYGLDPTTAQNDKLIYIAPPILEGIPDPIPNNRIVLIEKNNHTITIDFSPLTNNTTQQKTQTKLQELRTALGLPKRKTSTKTLHGQDYLANPDQAVFRGPYIDARGFRYGNLNNGDSYAYFHSLENPIFLHNFKGEPAVRIRDIDPDYWSRWLEEQRTTEQTDTHYTAFRDVITDTYYTIRHNTKTKQLEANVVNNLQKAQSFLSIHNQPIPEDIPLWKVIFDPTTIEPIDYEKQQLNLFQPSQYLTNANPSPDCPQKFYDLILHVVGGDSQFAHDLLNWLAYILQKRLKTQTAFVLHGTTGTGKGVLASILGLLIGQKHYKPLSPDIFDSTYNDWATTTLIAVVDEVRLNDQKNLGKTRLNTIKHLITEPFIEVKQKFKNCVTAPNYTNFIFNTNDYDGVPLSQDDRRFKVPPRQEHPINYTEEDINQLKDPTMLQAIANYLMGLQVDETLVRKVSLTEAKQDLINGAKDEIDDFLDIIFHGLLERLLEHADAPETNKNMIFRGRFLELLREWTAKVGQQIPISTTDLRCVFNFLFGRDISPQKFGKLLGSRNVKTQVIRKPGEGLARCLYVCWTLPSFQENGGAEGVM